MILDNSIILAKMDELEQDEDDVLSTRHKFLKVAVNEFGNASELEVDNMCIDSENIAIDGYYEEEDDKVLHILSVIYDDGFDKNFDFAAELNLKRAKIDNFIFFASSKKASKVTSSTKIFEAIDSLQNAIENGYQVMVDFYTNVSNTNFNNLPESYTYNKINVKLNLYYIEDILDAINSNNTQELTINLEKDFDSALDVVKISSSSNYDVYAGSFKGIALAKIYHKYKLRLLEGNVRSYLNRVQKTNAGISSTIRNLPADFCAYNNGLSVVASSSDSKIKHIAGDFYTIKTLNNMQIVNGGQTTVTIYMAYKENTNLRDVIVPVKITVIKKHENEAELVGNIAKYANTQTAIASSDLSSNDPFYVRMQQLSRTIPSYKNNIENDLNKYYWFFERTNGQYNTEGRIIYNRGKSFERHYPRKKKYSKKILAKAIMAFEQQPDIVCLGNEKNFEKFNKTVIENVIRPNEEYYKNFIGALILWRAADKIILKEKLPIKAAVLPYTIAKLSLETGRRIDLQSIWKNQTIPDYLKIVIKDMAIKISGYFTSILEEHPNTLMWGRKKECWTHIKNMPYQIPEIDPLTKSVYFLPENPANAYISIPQNMTKFNLWSALLAWNQEAHVLSQNAIVEITTWSNEMRHINIHLTVNQKSKLKEYFMKAVRNGFEYEGF